MDQGEVPYNMEKRSAQLIVGDAEGSVELLEHLHKDHRQEKLEKCIAAQEMQDVPCSLACKAPEEVNDELGSAVCEHIEKQVSAEVEKEQNGIMTTIHGPALQLREDIKVIIKYLGRVIEKDTRQETCQKPAWD